MINCTEVRGLLAMLLYGELSFDQEERIESHLAACAACRAALEREKALAAAFRGIEVEPAASLLRECRDDLHMLLRDAEPAPASRWNSAAWLRPAAALALVAIGFFGARLWPLVYSGERGAASHVRYVEPASDGRVRIVLDETRQREVTGRLDDARIRALLLTSARDPSDPGLREQAVDLLGAGAQAPDVREVLIYDLRNDRNAGVRLKAMEELKPFAQVPEVRAAVSQALLSDDNPGLRTQAIDLLTGGDGANFDRQLVGTLQELMERGEPQNYVRERCRRALAAMNASAETY